jgi:nicotinamidase-related amidase
MTLTTLDPRTALVVIDLQKGLLSYPTVAPIGDVIAASASLAKAFRAHHLPVVLVNATGRAPGRTEQSRPASASMLRPDGAEIVDELDAQPGDLRVSKQTWGAFFGTSLHDQLQELGVTQIVLTGVATSAGVESTARAAHEHGYHVTLVTDAMTDTDAATHQHSTEKIFPRIGETGTTAEVLDLLAQME